MRGPPFLRKFSSVVRAVLKKMSKMEEDKAPGLSGLVAEMIQAQWLLDLCNGIVKEGYIPEQGRYKS